MRKLADSSVDAIVTDPPYGIGFMGKAWDGAEITRQYIESSTDPDRRGRTGHAAAAGKYDLSPRGMLAFQAFSRAWAEQALRVLKPGGHLLCFASTRTYHRMVCGVEEAGFEVRDQCAWAFGSGFPKSRNQKGAWQGWGTALKPAWEPILMARKPLIGTVEANLLAHGTGAINIEGCRVPTDEDLSGGAYAETGGRTESPSLRAGGGMNLPGKTVGREFVQPVGRWPANILHDGSEEVLEAFPQAPGQIANASSSSSSSRKNQAVYGAMKRGNEARAQVARGDVGSAARFFYCAKADRADRNEGLQDPGPQFVSGRMPHDAEAVERAKRGNHHPTVKPTDLMRWLCRLITPPGGVVLDPFMGSGSTLKAAELEGFSAIGIELDPAYIEIAKRRIAGDAPLFAAVETA
jgi:DNA modification methylase